MGLSFPNTFGQLFIQRSFRKKYSIQLDLRQDESSAIPRIAGLPPPRCRSYSGLFVPARRRNRRDWWKSRQSSVVFLVLTSVGGSEKGNPFRESSCSEFSRWTRTTTPNYERRRDITSQSKCPDYFHLCNARVFLYRVCPKPTICSLYRLQGCFVTVCTFASALQNKLCKMKSELSDGVSTHSDYSNDSQNSQISMPDFGSSVLVTDRTVSNCFICKLSI